MKQEMDNEKMHGGENLTYMLVSRSLPVRMDRHGRKGTKEKCLQSPIYKTKNTHPEVNKSNIETYDKNKYYGIQNLKTRNPKSTICTEDHTTLWLMHSSSPGRAHC
jgi:hypothetical protein